MCNSEMTITWAWILGKGECILYVEHVIIFKLFLPTSVHTCTHSSTRLILVPRPLLLSLYLEDVLIEKKKGFEGKIEIINKNALLKVNRHGRISWTSSLRKSSPVVLFMMQGYKWKYFSENTWKIWVIRAIWVAKAL